MIKKTIAVGGYMYEINYDSVTAFKVLDKVIEWMQEKEHYASHSGESIMQDDNCQIDAPVLISDIIDDILKPESLD